MAGDCDVFDRAQEARDREDMAERQAEREARWNDDELFAKPVGKVDPNVCRACGVPRPEKSPYWNGTCSSECWKKDLKAKWAAGDARVEAAREAARLERGRQYGAVSGEE